MRDHQEVLEVLDNYLAHRAQFAGGEELPRVPHHRVAGVVVRQSEHESRLLDDLDEFPRLIECERHRLIADDMDSGFEERFGNAEVRRVGCDDACVEPGAVSGRCVAGGRR